LLDDIFRAGDGDTILKLMTGGGLFLKFWYIPGINPIYKETNLPGRIDGLSGSTLGGLTIAINKFISETQLKYAVEAVEYLTSKETQKELLLNSFTTSAIPSLYKDEDVCKVKDCELMNAVQLVPRPSNLFFNYDYFSEYYRKYIEEFLFENKTAVEVLNKIVDISKTYYIKFDPKECIQGFIVFILIIVLFLMIIGTGIFIFIKRKKSYFQFLNIQCWFVILFSYILHICAVMVTYGKLSTLKCHFKHILLSFGFTFSYVPIFYRLVCNFPERNSILSWIRRNRLKFCGPIILYDTIINIIFLGSPMLVDNKIINDGKNFEVCKFDGKSGIFVIFILLAEKLLIIAGIVFLLFIEWNLIETYVDIRLISAMICVDTLLYVLYMIGNIISINQYIAYFVWASLTIVTFIISNFSIMYGIRIFQALFKPEKDFNYIRRAIQNSTSDAKSSSMNYETSSKMSRSISKIIQYHYCKNNQINATCSYTNDKTVSFQTSQMSNLSNGV